MNEKPNKAIIHSDKVILNKQQMESLRIRSIIDIVNERTDSAKRSSEEIKKLKEVNDRLIQARMAEYNRMIRSVRIGSIIATLMMVGFVVSYYLTH